MQTTNADVTHDASGNALTGLAPYVFRIQADDHNRTPWPPTFPQRLRSMWKCGTHPTDITSPADQVIAEDNPITTIDWDARDEEVESTDSGYLKDTYYTLEIDKNADGTWENAGSLQRGQWSRSGLRLRPGHRRARLTPNNADVGVYNLRATHHDGHGSTAVDTVLLTVTNTPPVMVDPVLWELTEDDTTTADYTLDIQSDDEADGGVTYQLQVSQDGSGTDYVDWTSGYPAQWRRRR